MQKVIQHVIKKRLAESELMQEWFDYELGLSILHNLEQQYVNLLNSNQKYDNFCNSAIAYCIGITDEKPTAKITTAGGSLPDIDSDFEANKRKDIISYLQHTYGENKCAGICNVNTSQSKGAIRDVGRVLGIDINLVNEISDAIPAAHQGRSNNIRDVLEQNTQLKELYNTNADIKEWLDYAADLTGLIRSTGQHAAGCIISSVPVVDIVPCFYNKEGLLVTELDKDGVEKLGLIKFDILGLETLDIIRSTVEMLQEDNIVEQQPIVKFLDTLDINDPAIFDIAGKGHLSCVFQFDEPEFMKYVAKFKPENIDDLAFLSSINRPGPQAFKPKILKARFDRQIQPTYLIEELNDLLMSTDGWLVYQEQTMLIVKEICGYSNKDADNLRKIIGKKLTDQMDAERGKFFDGGLKNGYFTEQMNELWNLMVTFASYGFNVAHAIAYSYLSALCLYFKTYYYTYFMSAAIQSVMKDKKHLPHYIKELVDNNVHIDLIDVNYSKFKVTPVKNEQRIVLGLSFLKGITEPVAYAIINERISNGHYTSFMNFYRRTRSFLKKNHYEALLYLDAFQYISYNSPTLLSNIEYLYELNKKGFVDYLSDSDHVFIRHIDKDWTLLDRLNNEYAFLGTHFSDNILRVLKAPLSCMFIIDVKEIKTKKGQFMAFFVGIDAEDCFQACTIFPKLYSKINMMINVGNIVKVTSKRSGEDLIIEHCEEWSPPELNKKKQKIEFVTFKNAIDFANLIPYIESQQNMRVLFPKFQLQIEGQS